MTVECVLEAAATLGECPVWCPREKALYWIDTEEVGLHRFDPASGDDRVWPLAEHIGSFALREQGGVVLTSSS